MANSKLTELDLPAFDKLEEYNVVHVNGGGLGSQVLVKAGGEKIIISNNAFNELYVYLPESDSLILKTYESRLTPDQKTPYYPKQVDSDEALYRIYAKGLAEITFEPLIWDKVNERFYRFSYQTDLEVEMENGRQFESVNNSNIYLTVFDKNLEMLAESGIPELSKVSDTYFVKDGAIWIFENMEDELGFVRLRIDL
ncbi:DUF4221 family protein [Cyclobacterium sp. GBPx2]|uniref:DUF4221 family protein n=1 Tax=Cyclobacterium plantarum TaxID=2716263 RepID=A0ABX0HG64_9BACT|nr:DUF4221 family protein [Cyclobacterium plantarum]